MRWSGELGRGCVYVPSAVARRIVGWSAIFEGLEMYKLGEREGKDFSVQLGKIWSCGLGVL